MAVGTDRFDWQASGPTRSSDPISGGGEFREGLFSFALLPAEEGARPQRGLWSRMGTLGVTGLLGLRGGRAWAGTTLRRPTGPARGAEAPHRVARRLRVAAGAGASAALLIGLGAQVQMATSDPAPEAAFGRLSVATVADTATGPDDAAPAGSVSGSSGASAAGTAAGSGGNGSTHQDPLPPQPPAPPEPEHPVPPGGPPTGPLAQINVAIPGIAVIGIGLGEGGCTGAQLVGASAGCTQDTAAPAAITIETSGSALPALRIVIPA